ncbi:cellulase family glycosylhydrolase [Colwellia echini]|uniref:cellulase n=1 Tax=Colwellia echini TaxID=1982103 RepID=A0ABY3MV99_9GAMM|nr:cellulase family glycosylhydrolase [Colwellia echini]TYK65146.1 cellulase family glycosylhydrolase [Colwellia echini]
MKNSLLSKNIKIALGALIVSASLLPTYLSANEPLNNDDWLHVEGNTIVDEQGNKVWLTGANWFGFNASERTFHGLWAVNLDSAISAIANRGINILRVPISTELLVEWSKGIATTPSINTYVNPELEGLNNLEVFDQVIAVSKKYGVKILLDVHSAEADNSGHFAPLWYKGDITSTDFKESWEWVAARYANDDTLIAFDIQNEPHGQPWGAQEFAKWDDSTDENNFKFACEDVSNAILAINPKVLVLCEGIESYPKDGINWTSADKNDYHNNWWGGNLRGVKDFPIDLGANQDQLVYSPHDYGPLVFKQGWFYEGFDKDSLYQDVWKDNWMFIHEQGISPLLIGEWGGFMDGGDNEKWMLALRELIIENGLHHTFWCLNPNSGDTGGLLLNDWVTWDEEKYALFEPSLWKSESGKYIGLDHQVNLGSEATGTNVSDYYQSLIPSVEITSPLNGSQVTINSDVTINYDLAKLSSTAVYIDNVKVAIGSSTSALIKAPATEKDFTVKVVGVDADGNETNVTASIALASVNEIILPASIEITTPASGFSVEQGADFTVEVALTNAAAFKADFNGVSQTITDSNTATFTANATSGVSPLSVTALDENLQPLNAQQTIDITINEPTSLTCELGASNIWPGGFVLSDIVVTNTGSQALDSWSVNLNLPAGVTIDSGWGGKVTVIDSSTVQISNFEYNNTLAANGSVSIGVQGSYTGEFTLPSCTP